MKFKWMKFKWGAVHSSCRLDDLLVGRQDRAQVLVKKELQLLHRAHVGRIGRDDLDRAVLIGQREDSVFAGNRFGYESDSRWRDRHVGEVSLFR